MTKTKHQWPYQWPYNQPVPADHIVIPVVDGLDFVLTPGADAEDIAEAHELAARVRARREARS